LVLGLPGKHWLRRIEIERPVVRLHIDEDGLREFRNAADTDGAGSVFPWGMLLLNNGIVVVDTPNGGLDVTGIQITESDTPMRSNITIDAVQFTSGGIDELASDVRFEDVLLTPERVWVPSIELRSDALSLSGSFAAIVDGPLGGDLTISVRLPLLDTLVSPPVRFEGDVHVDANLSGTVGAPVVTAVVLAEEVRIHDEDHYGAPSFYQFEQAILEVDFRERWLTLGNGRIKWAKGEVLVEGVYDLTTTALQAVVYPHGIDLAEAVYQAGGPLKPWVTFTGDGEVHVAGTLSPVDIHGTMDVAIADFMVGSGPIREASTERLLTIPRGQVWGHIGITGDGIRLHGKRFVAGATSGDVNAYIGFDWTGPIDVQIDMDRTNLSTFRPLNDLGLAGFGGVRGRITGPFQDIKIAGKARFRDFEVVGVSAADEVRATIVCEDRETIRFDMIDGRKGQTRYQGGLTAVVGDEVDLDIDVSIAEGRIADLLDVVDVSTPSVDGEVTGSVTLRGNPSALTGDVVLDLGRMTLLGERFPTGRFVGWMDEGRFTIDDLSLSRWSGDEGVVIRGTIDDGWKTNVDVAATGLRLGRLDAFAGAKIPIRGMMYIDGRIGGTLFAPEPYGRVAFRDTWYAGKPVQDSTLFFETVGERLELQGHLLGEGLGFLGNIELMGDYRYQLAVDLEEFPLHTVLPVAADGGPVSAFLTGSVHAEGAFGRADDRVNIQAEGTALNIGWNRHQISAASPWSYQQTGKAASLKGLRFVGDQTDLHVGMATDESGRPKWWGNGTFDLDLVRIFVPDLTRAEGTAALRLMSRNDEGGLEVDIATCEATITGTWFPQPIEDMGFLVRLENEGYRLRALDARGRDELWIAEIPLLRRCASRLSKPSLTGTIGGGSVEAVGSIFANNWVPTRFELAAFMKQGTVQYFDFLPPMTGDVDLVLEGATDDLLLSGRIDIAQMLFSERIVWEEWLLEVDDKRLGGVEADESALFDLDLAVSAPNTIRMRNNVADLVATADLRVVGTTAEPGLIGDIRAVSGGRVHLKEREFEVQRAEIRFVDPITYDPDVDIVLGTDVRARDEVYDVEYRVGGTYENWHADTSSNPALESADINALLLFGMTRDDLERYGGLGGALAIEGGDLLASRVLFSSRAGSERGGLFSIVNPLKPDRLDLVSGVSERGSGLVSSDLRLLYENELDDVSLPGTLMIFEQNITRASDTYLGLEQRLARTLFARTYWASEQRGRHLPIGGAYGLEVKVRWELD
jgi:hypothetical protein